MNRLLFLLVLALVLPSTSGAMTFTYSATLSGANEYPANGSLGSGSATVTYDDQAHTLVVDITFSGLSAGNTAAHIHCCVSPLALTPTAGVATVTPTFTGFPTGATSGSYLHTFDLTDPGSFNTTFLNAYGGTAAGAEAALGAGLAVGYAYVNIHTTNFPGGEIRGFLVPVPEPSAAALLGLAVGALALYRRVS